MTSNSIFIRDHPYSYHPYRRPDNNEVDIRRQFLVKYDFGNVEPIRDPCFTPEMYQRRVLEYMTMVNDLYTKFLDLKSCAGLPNKLKREFRILVKLSKLKVPVLRRKRRYHPYRRPEIKKHSSSLAIDPIKIGPGFPALQEIYQQIGVTSKISAGMPEICQKNENTSKTSAGMPEICQKNENTSTITTEMSTKQEEMIDAEVSLLVQNILTEIKAEDEDITEPADDIKCVVDADSPHTDCSKSSLTDQKHAAEQRCTTSTDLCSTTQSKEENDTSVKTIPLSDKLGLESDNSVDRYSNKDHQTCEIIPTEKPETNSGSFQSSVSEDLDDYDIDSETEEALLRPDSDESDCDSSMSETTICRLLCLPPPVSNKKDQTNSSTHNNDAGTSTPVVYTDADDTTRLDLSDGSDTQNNNTSVDNVHSQLDTNCVKTCLTECDDKQVSESERETQTAIVDEKITANDSLKSPVSDAVDKTHPVVDVESVIKDTKTVDRAPESHTTQNKGFSLPECADNETDSKDREQMNLTINVTKVPEMSSSITASGMSQMKVDLLPSSTAENLQVVKQTKPARMEQKDVEVDKERSPDKVSVYKPSKTTGDLIKAADVDINNNEFNKAIDVVNKAINLYPKKSASTTRCVVSCGQIIYPTETDKQTTKQDMKVEAQVRQSASTARCVALCGKIIYPTETDKQTTKQDMKVEAQVRQSKSVPIPVECTQVPPQKAKPVHKAVVTSLNVTKPRLQPAPLVHNDEYKQDSKKSVEQMKEPKFEPVPIKFDVHDVSESTSQNSKQKFKPVSVTSGQGKMASFGKPSKEESKLKFKPVPITFGEEKLPKIGKLEPEAPKPKLKPVPITAVESTKSSVKQTVDKLKPKFKPIPITFGEDDMAKVVGSVKEQSKPKYKQAVKMTGEDAKSKIGQTNVEVSKPADKPKYKQAVKMLGENNTSKIVKPTSEVSKPKFTPVPIKVQSDNKPLVNKPTAETKKPKFRPIPITFGGDVNTTNNKLSQADRVEFRKQRFGSCFDQEDDLRRKIKLRK